MSLITDVLAIDGLKRAWPADGGIAVELVDRRGHIRAGLVTPSGMAMSLYACDPVLGQIPVGQGELVVHRHARRAVVIADRFVTKHVRKGGERIARKTMVAGRAYRSWGLAVADVTQWTSTSVTYTRLPGRSLGDLGDEGLPGWKALTQAWQATRDYVLEAHTGAHEAHILARWAGQASAFETVPDNPLLTQAVLDVSARLADDTDASRVLSHADLHDGQLLWDVHTLGVIDLDGVRMADPALDLMNLRAHAELHHLRGFLSAHALDTIIGLLDDVASSMPTTSARLDAYLRSARLRLIFVHSFRPGARSWLQDWTHHALSSSTLTP